MEKRRERLGCSSRLQRARSLGRSLGRATTTTVVWSEGSECLQKNSICKSPFLRRLPICSTESARCSRTCTIYEHSCPSRRRRRAGAPTTSTTTLTSSSALFCPTLLLCTLLLLLSGLPSAVCALHFVDSRPLHPSACLPTCLPVRLASYLLLLLLQQLTDCLSWQFLLVGRANLLS